MPHNIADRDQRNSVVKLAHLKLYSCIVCTSDNSLVWRLTKSSNSPIVKLKQLEKDIKKLEKDIKKGE
jgi:rRNA-processing protein FCF1